MMDWAETVIREVFEKKVPTLLLGSGVSISTGLSLNLKPNFPGMPDLAKRIHDNLCSDGLKAADCSAWQEFRKQFAALKTRWWQFNLEAFLADNPLKPDSLLHQRIVEQTVQAFQDPHKALAEAVEADPDVTYPFREIMSNLLRSVPAIQPCLTVVTPNYDLLVEYTCDLIGVPCMTGFSGKIIRKWMPQVGFSQPVLRQGGGSKLSTCVQLIKPHGSFAWHKSSRYADQVVECFSTYGLSGDWRRCIITPGPTKYAESLKDVRREHMHRMDNVFKTAQSLLVLGYGFNDPHLEEHLKSSLKRGVPAIYVTKELSDDVRAAYVTPYPQATCITKSASAGSRIQTGGKDFIIDTNLWQLQQFAEEFIN